MPEVTDDAGREPVSSADVVVQGIEGDTGYYRR